MPISTRLVRDQAACQRSLSAGHDRCLPPVPTHHVQIAIPLRPQAPYRLPPTTSQSHHPLRRIPSTHKDRHANLGPHTRAAHTALTRWHASPLGPLTRTRQDKASEEKKKKWSVRCYHVEKPSRLKPSRWGIAPQRISRPLQIPGPRPRVSIASLETPSTRDICSSEALSSVPRAPPSPLLVAYANTNRNRHGWPSSALRHRHAVPLGTNAFRMRMRMHAHTPSHQEQVWIRADRSRNPARDEPRSPSLAETGSIRACLETRRQELLDHTMSIPSRQGTA